MAVQEARQVLNVEEAATKEAILKVGPRRFPASPPQIVNAPVVPQNFEHFHELNAKTEKQNGSPFLQAKIMNAKESLLKELGEEDAKPPEEEAGGGAAAGEEGKKEDAGEEKKQ